MLIALARLASAEHVGTFGLALAVTAPFVVFANLNLRTVQSTDAANEYRFSDYLGARILWQMFALILIVCAALIWSEPTAYVIILVGLAKVFESLTDLTQGYLHLHGQTRLAARSLALRGILTLSALAVGVASSGLVAGVGLMAVIWATAAFFDLRTVAALENQRWGAKSWIPRFSSQTLRSISLIGIPLGVVAALGSFRTNLPRYVIEASFGPEILGYFTAISYTLVAANVGMIAIGHVMAPRLAAYLQSARMDDARRIVTRLVQLSVCLGLLGVLVAHFGGSQILSFTYGPAYSAYGPDLTWMMAATGFSFLQIVGSTAVSAARMFRIQPLISFIGLSVTSLLSFALVPEYGVTGATFAIVGGYLSEGTIYAYVCIGPGGALNKNTALADRDSATL